MTEKKIPFVGLHAHSVAGSIFDAIGYPDEHMDFCYENGGEALALTDHGNMNGFSHQFLHWQKKGILLVRLLRMKRLLRRPSSL